MSNKRTFFELFETKQPVLKVKFDVNSNCEATEVEIKNSLEKDTDVTSLENFKKLYTNPNLAQFFDFYTKCNGFSLATPMFPNEAKKSPLLLQFPINQIVKFTELYLPEGKFAGIIDFNKTKTLYRGEHKWLAFAQINGGPACLTIFLEGEYAGNVFLVTPQPHFNILKPIAKTFDGFLNRIVKDPAAFFKLTRAYVSIIGRDNQSFGYVPLEYINSGGILFSENGEKVTLELIRSNSEETKENIVKNKWWRFRQD